MLAAQTAVDRDTQARERELAKSDNPLVRRLARALLDASKMTLDEAWLAVEKELEVLRRATKIAKETLKFAGSSGQGPF